MEHQAAIQKAIDYIEEYLQTDISNTALAQAAGYSEYHFLRIFKAVTGLTPADYIRKRRISEIVRRIGTEKGSIADLAFAYGFHSKENFVRAFKREHRILPTDFRAAQNSLKLYSKLELIQPEWKVEAELIHMEPLTLVVYPCDEAYPPHFWNKYNANGWSKRLTGGITTEDYGVSIWNSAQEKLDYYIGVRKAEAMGDLSGAIQLDISGGLYAVFETPPADHFTFVSSIHRTWDYIGRIWLEENGYRRTGGPEYETYVEESRTYREKICIPIIRRVYEEAECNI